ncbi:hypothetical protein MNBD_ALPHA12-1491 [hydrothermal vent metagenome]|uniref:N-acetyltransferase domain-containing protein n=1 Tax=hydrothermal vent metagenome TaxID=652676 RepID=A0A3B0UD25_9ZZZZ
MSRDFSTLNEEGENALITENQSPGLVVRKEVDADLGWIEQLHASAFGPGRFARSAFRVREAFARDKTLSLVAQFEGKPVASVWMTPISVSGENGYLLGPLATDPGFRNKGAGRLLVSQVSKMALARRQGNFVLLVGDAPYYAPLGYVRAIAGGIIFPGPVDPGRILVHCRDPERANILKGRIGAFDAK